MAEGSPTPRSSTPSSTIPQKRALAEDDAHAPAVSSPLNPDFANARARKAPPAREQREKKESLKKREAKGDTARAGTPDTPSHGRGSKKKGQEAASNNQTLIRYTIPAPKVHDFDPPGAPVLMPSMTRANREFYESQEQ
jgi:COMPASS component BRE2